MKNITILLDNGHGGIIKGIYQTAGKRSPIWPDGTQLFEGEFNRAIVNGVIVELNELGIPCVNIVPALQDISLKDRVARANKYKNSVYISIHSNAGGGSGFEAHTSVGKSVSDIYADFFYKEFSKEFPKDKARTDYSDGDADWESPFYVLKNTNMPAILCEWFFMDNMRECKEYLMTKTGRDRIIKVMVEAIKKIVEYGV